MSSERAKAHPSQSNGIRAQNENLTIATESTEGNKNTHSGGLQGSGEESGMTGRRERRLLSRGQVDDKRR